MLFILFLYCFFRQFCLNLLLLSLLLLLIYLIPLINHLFERLWIISIPPIPLRFKVQLRLRHYLILHYNLIPREVPLRVLHTHLPRSLRASLHIMSHRPAVRARPLPVLSHLLLLLKLINFTPTPTIPRVIYVRLDSIPSRPLMRQHLLIVLLIYVPWRLLYVLWHVRQIYFWSCSLFGWVFSSRHIFKDYNSILVI